MEQTVNRAEPGVCKTAETIVGSWTTHDEMASMVVNLRREFHGWTEPYPGREGNGLRKTAARINEEESLIAHGRLDANVRFACRRQKS
jgi:hypothetical protein